MSPTIPSPTKEGSGRGRCPYCGRRIGWQRVTCCAHEDLPALEPLADFYLLAVKP